MKRIIPINKEPGYEWDVYGDGTYILVLQEDLKSWLPKPTFDTQFFKVDDNVIVPKIATHKTSIKSNIEIDSELGDENAFLNKKGEFTTPITSHKDLTDQNSEAEFQHVTQAEKDLITSTATIVNGNTEDISDLQTTKANKATTLLGYEIEDAYTKTEIDNKISAVFRYKGSVPTYVDLIALTGMTIGDVYNVTETGDNYAWTSTEWDKLSGEIDLSAYLTSADASNTYETIANVNLLGNIVSTNTNDIESLEANKANTSHTHTKSEVGLDNVDNTSDINKPVSNATQTALNSKADKDTTLSGYGITDAYTKTEIDTNLESYKTYSDVTREELLDLINNNELIPNSSYSITNYTTTTAQADTTSAGHDFDVIVTALSTNKLSENAKCIRKAGDTYFANAQLESWEIKYCINNDTSRFAWADTENGKGVIYYMKDEWNNECPYDFKNIQYLKNSVLLYTFGGTSDNSLTGYCYYNTMMAYMVYTSTSGYVSTLNFNTFGTNCYSNTFGNNCTYNTFSDFCSFNTFGDNCSFNKFIGSCWSNTFGDKCQSNTFGNSCSSNTFGYYCSSNTFDTSCYSNTFGSECNSNVLAYNCISNTFGDKCKSNTFGRECTYNTFSDNCLSNTFGNSCSSNTFGNSCSSNTFGEGCTYNTFSNSCSTNAFGNKCNGNTFSDSCYSNTFGISCDSNTFGHGCYSNKFYTGAPGTTTKNYLRYIVLEDGCRNNNFYSTVTTSITSYLQRIRIKGLDFKTTTNTQITLLTVKTNYEWLICYTSAGTLKQYCPND